MNINTISSTSFKADKSQWLYDDYKKAQRQQKRIVYKPIETKENQDFSQTASDAIKSQALIKPATKQTAISATEYQEKIDKLLNLIDMRAGSNLAQTMDRELLAAAFVDYSKDKDSINSNSIMAGYGKEIITGTYSNILTELNSDLEYEPSQKAFYLRRLTSDQQLSLLAKKYGIDELVLRSEFVNKDELKAINAKAFCAFIGAIALSSQTSEIKNYFSGIFSDIAEEEIYGASFYQDKLKDFISTYGDEENYSEIYSKEDDKTRVTLMYKNKILASGVNEDKDIAYSLACEVAYKKLKNGRVEIDRKPVY